LQTVTSNLAFSHYGMSLANNDFIYLGMEFCNTLVRLSWLLVKNTNGEKIQSKPAKCGLALYFLIVLFVQQPIVAQTYNLVPNPSFEQYTVCPFYLTKPPPPPWYMPCHDGLVYCNSCCTDTYASVPLNVVGGISYQYAHTGSAYIYLDYVNYVGSNERAYIQVALKDSLKKNKYYYGEYFVNIPNTLRYACNNVGMLFTDTTVYSDPNRLTFNVIPANPQVVNAGNPILGDTLSWVKISGIFKAKGGERYLTLGNFKYDTQTLYKTIQPTVNSNAKAGYYIDDVSVIPLDSMCLKADAGKDTAISLGDSVFIGSYTNGIDSLRWLQGTIVIDSLRPGFWVYPTITTSYILQQVVNGCYSTDTVTVTVGTVPLKFISYTLRQAQGDNPSSLQGTKQSVENIWQTANEVNVSHFNIQRSLNGNNFITIGKVAAQNKVANEYSFYDSPPLEGLGVVYYRIESQDFDGRKQYSEIRTLNLKPQTLNGVSIYPNPAKNFVNVSCTGMKELKVIDELGQTVIHQITSNTTHKLNVSLLRKGVYVLSIFTAKGETKNEKLIVQ